MGNGKLKYGISPQSAAMGKGVCIISVFPGIINFAFCILHFALLSLLLCGCSHRGGSVAADVDVSGWDSGTGYSVVYGNRDSLSPRELSVFVLHEGSFGAKADSLLLTVTTVTPDSLIVSEEWAFYPDRPAAGRVLQETVQLYRSHVVLGRKGPYTFTFSHHSALPVEGIKGIGLIVENLEI